MPTLRIEALQDAASGLFYLAIHMPAESGEPFVTTAPRYASAAAARAAQVQVEPLRGST